MCVGGGGGGGGGGSTKPCLLTFLVITIFSDFLACSDKEDAPVIVFISKMVPVEKKLLPHNKQR